MYCSGCGNPVNHGLRYCNKCGVEIPSSRSIAAIDLSTPLGYIGAFGLFGFFGVILVLVRSGATEEMILKIAFLYLAALFGICFLILRQIAGDRNRAADRTPTADDRPAELRPLTTSQLDAWSEPSVSVTEVTTRSLGKEPVLRK